MGFKKCLVGAQKVQITMNNKLEIALSKHIKRLEKDIKGRDQTTWSDGTRCNPHHAQLDEVDLKNIASLREGRVPQYGDHILCLLGDDEYPMREFSDISEEMRGAAVN